MMYFQHLSSLTYLGSLGSLGLVVLLALSLLNATLQVAHAASESNLIAYVNGAGDLWLRRSDGTGQRQLASGDLLQAVASSERRVQGSQGSRDFYSWPVWSPDGQRLACFRTVANGNGRNDELYLFDVASGRVLNAYKEPGLQLIYAYWAPNGQQVAVLLGEPGTIALGLWPLSGGQRPSTIAAGAPFYFDWRADARALIVHTGSDPQAKAGHSVSLLDVENGHRHLVSQAPAVFGAPSWSHDGRWLAYGAEEQGAHPASLMIAAADGSTPQSFASVSARIAIAWSPAQSRVAVATTSFAGDPLFEKLLVIDVPSGKVRTLVKDHFAAYFWSPNGQRILYAQRNAEADLWTWIVTDVQSGNRYPVTGFIPSRPLLQVFQFFDQYALSHRLWSPDSSHFVFTGSAGSKAHPAEALRSPTVYVVEAAEHAIPKALSDGHVAFWSPH